MCENLVAAAPFSFSVVVVSCCPSLLCCPLATMCCMNVQAEVAVSTTSATLICMVWAGRQSPLACVRSASDKLCGTTGTPAALLLPLA